MFGIKTQIINRFKSRFYKSGLNGKKISKIENRLLNVMARNELKNETHVVDLQGPIAKKTNPFAAAAIRATADYMPNNLGNWSIKKPYTFTSRLELNLVEVIKEYYGNDTKIAGHFSSGSTEGNIYAAWIGRNYLTKKLSLKNSEKIVLIKSSLAHYSLDKAADIIGVKLVKASIDKNQFNLDQKELLRQIGNLYSKGFRGFLIPLTLGYTVTGTDDDYQTISGLVADFAKKHQNCEFFLWLDAAFSGISKIFTEKKFRPLAHKNIYLISTDFHKFLAVPYPASILLYKKQLLSYIQKNIPYIDQLDTTLLGSRPGINVLATWLSLINVNKKMMNRVIKKALRKKESFLHKISQENCQIQIINNRPSLQACLVSKDELSKKILSEKYQLQSIKYHLLFNGTLKTINIYKLYFLPEFA